jgi:signal transduction histidine kinase
VALVALLVGGVIAVTLSIAFHMLALGRVVMLMRQRPAWRRGSIAWLALFVIAVGFEVAALCAPDQSVPWLAAMLTWLALGFLYLWSTAAGRAVRRTSLAAAALTAVKITADEGPKSGAVGDR